MCYNCFNYVFVLQRIVKMNKTEDDEFDGTEITQEEIDQINGWSTRTNLPLTRPYPILLVKPDICCINMWTFGDKFLRPIYVRWRWMRIVWLHTLSIDRRHSFDACLWSTLLSDSKPNSESWRFDGRSSLLGYPRCLEHSILVDWRSTIICRGSIWTFLVNLVRRRLGILRLWMPVYNPSSRSL